MRDGIVGALRIGDVALRAVDNQFSSERSTPADLDRIAKRFRIRRLADEAMIEMFALFSGPLQQFRRAVDGGTFLVAGDQQPDRSLKSGFAAR